MGKSAYHTRLHSLYKVANIRYKKYLRERRSCFPGRRNSGYFPYDNIYDFRSCIVNRVVFRIAITYRKRNRGIISNQYRHLSCLTYRRRYKNNDIYSLPIACIKNERYSPHLYVSRRRAQND